MNKLIIALLLAIITISCTSVYEQQRQMIQAQTTNDLQKLDRQCHIAKYNAGVDGLVVQELSECLDTGECFEQFVSRLTLRYEYADWERTNLIVKAYPDTYSTPIRVELLLLKSHNSNVDDACNEQRMHITEASNSAIAEVNQREREAVQEVINAINQSIAESTSDVKTECYGNNDKATCYTTVK